MNNKIHEGEDGMEGGDGEKFWPVKIFPENIYHYLTQNTQVAMVRRERQRSMRLFLYGAGVSQFVLGAVVMVLNIVFIYDGMNSGWYGDQGGLRVVSIGEGIIAGQDRF